MCQSFCFESLDLLVNKSLVIKCSNYLLPAKFFLSFICRCINLRSISRPSWTQLQWNFLKGYNFQWIKRNLNWLFHFFFGATVHKMYMYIRKINNYLAGSFLKCRNHFKHRCTTTSSQVVSSTT